MIHNDSPKNYFKIGNTLYRIQYNSPKDLRYIEIAEWALAAFKDDFGASRVSEITVYKSGIELPSEFMPGYLRSLEMRVHGKFLTTID